MASSLSFPCSWSKDGRILVGMELTQMNISTRIFDIGLLPLTREGKWQQLLAEKCRESRPRVSADGHWLAYTSNESGKNEIYVRPFPEVDKGRWQISTTGGDSPLWLPDGKELYYRNGDAVMEVSVKTEGAFSADTPRVLFRGTWVPANITVLGVTELSPWDISPDGKRFLMMKEEGQGTPAVEGPRRINMALDRPTRRKSSHLAEFREPVTATPAEGRSLSVAATPPQKMHDKITAVGEIARRIKRS